MSPRQKRIYVSILDKVISKFFDYKTLERRWNEQTEFESIMLERSRESPDYYNPILLPEDLIHPNRMIREQAEKLHTCRTLSKR